MQEKLAIIIPAYKHHYLSLTLNSLANQTNKNFCVYIGDDASPYDIKSIVEEFSDKLNIVYKRFQKNIGGSSLTKQWERCVELSSEDWIWLFSDDDIATKNCVEKFYKSIESSESKVYKFNTKIIDTKEKIILKKFDSKNSFQKIISTEHFLGNRLDSNGFRSFAVEYIFHRDFYNKLKFVEFPLAWASDDATWLVYSRENNGYLQGIDADVFWRWSGENISSSVVNNDVNEKKVKASYNYANWVKNFTKSNIFDAKILRWVTIQIASLRYPITYSVYKNDIYKLKLNVTKLDLIKNFLIIKYYHIRNRF